MPDSSATTTSTPDSVNSLQNFINKVASLSVAKQVSLVIALAATIALTISVILWSQSEDYALLFGELKPKDVNEVIQVLDKEKVPYKLDEKTGAILVPADQVYPLRIKLAAAGFPKETPTGYQLLDKDQGFGISQFKETTQYHRALEGELAKSVASINAVKSARVMLGLPKRSVFVRKQKPATASVVVQLYPGRSLSEEQVSAIVHLVSSSVPNLDPKNVTVVDQNGNLLTDNSQTGSMRMSMKQLEYTRDIESTLSRRIIQLLSPIVGGEDKVRAQVTAELDFTQQEQTRENYEPDPEAVRSEQTVKEINREQGPTGIPGALTNQPPRAGIAPEEGYSPEKDPNLKSSKEKTTKNFELNRMVSHVKNSVGNIKRLSVAVVVDNKTTLDKDGNVVSQPRSDGELQSYRRLVSDAVGLDETRGDTLSVVNAPFAQPMTEEDVTPIWQQGWFINLIKQVLAGLAIFLIIFGVIRPMLKDLSKPDEFELEYQEGIPEEDEEDLENAEEISQALEQMNQEIDNAEGQVEEEMKEEEDLVNKVKEIVESDPKAAAYIIREWLKES
ncbi:flagellar basal-body MS-ring/collar protein FliF [Galenea microaerophila]